MKKQIIIVCGVGLCAGALAFLWFHKSAKDVSVSDTKHASEIQAARQAQKNVAGIAAHVLQEHAIAHEAFMREADFAGERKKWIIVQITDRDAWDALDREKKEYLLQGLINTSRLQGDNDFGGVQIIHDDEIVTQGWWDAVKKYVIL